MANLTPREREVLALTDGRPIHELAKELGITERTAKAHSDSLRAKLGVKYRWQLVALKEKNL